MNEEEIEAIKMCRLLLNGDITLHIIDDDGGTAYAGTVNKTYNDDLETVLNLLEKKDKMIEYMANFINDNTPYTKDTRILENERGVRNTKYTEQYFKYKVEEGK